MSPVSSSGRRGARRLMRREERRTSSTTAGSWRTTRTSTSTASRSGWTRDASACPLSPSLACLFTLRFVILFLDVEADPAACSRTLTEIKKSGKHSPYPVPDATPARDMELYSPPQKNDPCVTSVPELVCFLSSSRSHSGRLSSLDESASTSPPTSATRPTCRTSKSMVPYSCRTF